MIASYIADFPELQSLLALRRKASAASPSLRRLLHGEIPRDLTFEASRTMSDTMKNMTRNDGGSEIKTFLAQASTNPLLSVLHDFPFVGINSCVDIYRVFRCELMDKCSSFLSPSLNECM